MYDFFLLWNSKDDVILAALAFIIWTKTYLLCSAEEKDISLSFLCEPSL